jgi:CubicO group peptidase (beta-lactamase class C family)
MSVTPAGFVDSFKSKPLEFSPGEKMKYDNSGYFTLGYIIEKVSGQSYETFLQENICVPPVARLDGTIREPSHARSPITRDFS